MCMQDAHNGQHSSPSNSHAFARFLYKNWLGWNSTDSFSCLKTRSCRRNGDSLCDVLEDSFGSPHGAPVHETRPYLPLLSAAAFLKSARRATGAAEAEDMLTLHWQHVEELSTGGHGHTTGRREHEDHARSCSLKSFCFRGLVPGWPPAVAVLAISYSGSLRNKLGANNNVWALKLWPCLPR